MGAWILRIPLTSHAYISDIITPRIEETHPILLATVVLGNIKCAIRGTKR